MTRRHLLFDEDALASDTSDDDDVHTEDSDSSLDNFIVDDDIDEIDDVDEEIEFDDLDSDDFEVVNSKKAKARTGSSGPSRNVRKPKSSSRAHGRPESSSCASGRPNSSSCSLARPPSSTSDMMTATPTKKPRGRPRSGAAVPMTKYTNPPGHPHYPINNFSLTVSRLKQDIAPTLLDVIHTFLSQYAIKSGLSTEVGHRAFNLHLQGTFSMRYPSDATAIADLSKLIKQEIKETVKSLTGYRVVLKALGRGQAFSTMIGYVTKDEGMLNYLHFVRWVTNISFVGQPHYQIRLHNVSRADLDQGRREHTSMLSNLDDNKKIINMKNFFNECYRFNKRCFAPVVVPVDFALLYMMQSQNYILTPDFIAQYRKMDFNEATTLWRMIHEPTQTTIEDVRAIVFDPRTYDNRRVSSCHQRYCDTDPNFLFLQTSNRYYMSGAFQPTNDNVEDTFPDGAEDGDSVVTSAVDRRPCLATRLVSHMRQANVSAALSSTKERLYPSSQQDIIPLPDSPPSLCHVQGDAVSHICPPTVDEMMNFVRGVRETVSTTQSAIVSAVLSTPTRRREDSTDVEEDTPADKRQRHNYDMFT